MASEWIKYLSNPGSIRVVVLHATELVDEMAKLHALSGGYARAMGEATVAALMLATYAKPGEKVNLQVQGSAGRVAQALVDASPDGKVRGYLIARESAEFAEDAPLWGDQGFVSVLRTKGTEGRQPYVGTVPLVSDDLSRVLERYWALSEQLPTSLEILVRVESGRVTLAGGILIQALGEADEQERRWVESRSPLLRQEIAAVLESPDPAREVTRVMCVPSGAVPGEKREFLEIGRDPLRFECQCSWDRVERALVLAGVDELRHSLEREGFAEVSCDFCTRHYHIASDRLKELIQIAESRG